MMGLIKTVARRLFGDYEIYFVYRVDAAGAGAWRPPVDMPFTFAPLEDAGASRDDPLVRSQSEYLGPGARAFACLEGSRVVGACFFWSGDRYRQRNFWPLAAGEAKLVQIVTLPEMRGRGIAAGLIGHAAQAMVGDGFHHLYARIWHSNKPSWRAFERAGWTRAALVVELYPLGGARKLRLRVGRRPRGEPA